MPLNGVSPAAIGFTNRGFVCEEEVLETVRAESHGALPMVAYPQGENTVKILNGWDSQGNQITDDSGVYHCVRGCGGAGYQQGYVLQHMGEQDSGSECYAWTYRGREGGCNVEMQHELSYAIREPSGGGSAPNILYKIGAFMGGQGPKARTIAWSEKVSPTIKNVPSGGNTIPDVVYPINTMVATRGGRDDMRTCFGIGEPGDPQFTISAAHSHGVCYEAICIQGNMVDRNVK